MHYMFDTGAVLGEPKLNQSQRLLERSLFCEGADILIGVPGDRLSQ